MDPWRVVLGCKDHRFGARQAAGVLPAARLTEHVEAAYMAAHDATLGHLLGGPVDLGDVAFRRRGELADYVDVRPLLDQRLADPGRVPGILDHHSQLAPRRHETIAREAARALGAVLELHMPLRRRHTPALQETDLPLQRVGVLAGLGVRHMWHGPVDGV